MSLSWSEIVQEFGVYPVEPDDLIYAERSTEMSGGHVIVLYKVGDTYFMIEGSYLSGTQLKDQWVPKAHTLSELVEILHRAIPGMAFSWRDEAYLEILKVLESRLRAG